MTNNRRRIRGEETWHRLLEWQHNSATAERLGVQILMINQYESVDPSHPLGGKDGLKDFICKKENICWIGACYFPRGQKSYKIIKQKFIDDLKGVKKNKARGFVFITNQELKLSQRKAFELIAKKEKFKLDLIHLERLAALLNSTVCYGIRLDFLDIEMTKEEQLAYLATIDEFKNNVLQSIIQYVSGSKQKDLGSHTELPLSVHYVMPEYHLSTLGISLYDSPYRRCSYCHYGYFIHNSGFTTTSPIFAQRTVTCPKCGNVDDY